MAPETTQDTAEEAQRHRLIIVGSGPAGLTAALYAARSGLEPLILEGVQPGGQLTTTTDVENYPAFPDGIMGPDLIDRMREQAKRFGTDARFEHVETIDFSQRPFLLATETQSYSADTVIVATGASAKYLGLESETALLGFGVSACATCDGFFFRDKEIAVVGGGDTALEEALFLTKFASKVTVIHRRGELRASHILQERSMKNQKIEFLWNHEVVEVKGSKEDGVTSLTVKSTESGEVDDFPVQGVFIAIGHQPNTQLFEDVLAMDDVGYLEVKHPSTRTSLEGVFAAGDVMDPHYRQAITAAGSGCQAAIDAERWLAEQ